MTAGVAVATDQSARYDEFGGFDLPSRPVGGPVWVAWREGTATRAKESESLDAWLSRHLDASARSGELSEAIHRHIEAARDAAKRRRRLRPAEGR